MPSEREIFDNAILSQLADSSWETPQYRRTAAACLVQGTYDLQRDRRKKLQGPKALAPAWWKSFGFELYDTLLDDRGRLIVGAIYEHRGYHPWNMNIHPGQNPPRYVVAFRGTKIRLDTMMQDLKSDYDFISHKLHRSSRFHRALEAVKKIVDLAGVGNVWLAGHSLGSAIALLVGKDMAANSHVHLETYLFNPPFASWIPIELLIKNETLKDGIRKVESFATAALAVAVSKVSPNPGKKNSFNVLSEWIPNLFINPRDPICCEYIGYFERRDKMKAIGAGKVDEIATQNSKLGGMYDLLGKSDREAVHLMPSACLTINRSHDNGLFHAHGLKQWYKKGLNIHHHSTCYKFN